MKPRMKVHVVEADFSGAFFDAVAKRDALGRSIAGLADRVNQPVFFHDDKEPRLGAPVIMLECSDHFLDLVRKMPGFSKAYDLPAERETERKPEIGKHFLQPEKKLPPKPKGLKPPGM